MDDTEMDIVLRAVDEASDTFEQVQTAAEEMGDSVQGGAESGSEGLDEMEASAEAASDPLEQITTIIGGLAGAEIFSQLADTLWDFADKAGTFEDSLMRARLEAEGAGISVNDMTDTVSELGRVTGRAGGEIRESFIKATARGITDLNSFKSMMIGAGAQATLLGTDINTMADKMSGLAMRSSVMERTLANTGITVEELGKALGIQGATIDTINDKWATLDTNQRAAALGMAASMNEGQNANEEYKKSWAGLQAQIDIARGRLERLAGEILLPVLVPALEIAARVLNFLGDTVSAVMKGPFGGLISVLGSAVAAFALLVPAVMAVNSAMGLFTNMLKPAIIASWELIAPWLPFIAVGAAVAIIIYEIGKAFGWWTDIGSMVDAIWAGVQRLWSAFINHPDVQGFLFAIGQAWNMILPYIQSAFQWVMSFFTNANSSGRFDFVRSLINAIGTAWNTLTAPIRLVIKVIQLLWATTRLAGNNIRNTINNIHAWFAALPGRIRGAISSLINIIAQPFKDAYTKITGTVNDIKSTVGSLTNISLSGLTDKIFGPVRDAYNKIKGKVDEIKNKLNEIPVIGGIAAGGEELLLLNEGKQLNTTQYNTSGALKVDQNINLKLDLANVPGNVDEEIIYGLIRESFNDKTVLNALVNNTTFQDMDQRVKNRMSMRNNRARGGSV